MILLDWTRMGTIYCLAGAVVEGSTVRTVRPLLSRGRPAPVRNVGWSPFLLDGHQRWDVFELVGPEIADPQPPHLEDVWVRTLRPRRRSAPPEQRRAVLHSLTVGPGELLFGTPLNTTCTAAFVNPSEGQRSLATLIVPNERLTFNAVQRHRLTVERQGHSDTDFRVSLDWGQLAGRSLPLKDHHLLRRTEQAVPDLTGRVQALTRAVRAMGERVAVRLGVSRPFRAKLQGGPGPCWLMVDGLFSVADPQP
jgi:hypothetical protein